MANPVLVTQETPWSGFTVDSAVEAVLRTRGMSNDAATALTPAQAWDDADVRRCLRQAVDELFAKYPNTYSVRTYTAAWTSGDHSIALPAGAEAGVFAVRLGGRPLDVLSRNDYERILKTDEQGGGVAEGTAERPFGWRIVGFTDADAGTDPGDVDYRAVLRIYPTPTGTPSLEVDYATVAPALAVGGDTLPMSRPLQRWVVYRATEMWASERGDAALVGGTERQRIQTEETLHSWFDLYRDRPTRATTRYPRVTRHSRRK